MEKSIGMFDSGLGGLSVWREVVKTLPQESIIYYADSGNCPYGQRSRAEIIELSKKNTEFLLEKGAKLIVIACNTATAAAIQELRKCYDVPFVGMEPAVKPAAAMTKTGHIGVLATKGTLESEQFSTTARHFAQGVTVHLKVGEGLVELVENLQINSEAAFLLLEKYLRPMIEKKVDTIVLGCTHYPFLMETMQKILPKNVALIDPAPAVATQIKRQLEHFALLSTNLEAPNYTFYTSGDTEILNRFLLDRFGFNFFYKKTEYFG